MNKENTNQWLSAYLYYGDPIEGFLTDSVLPFIQSSKKSGICKQFFFIRYRDRGPHIRLRMKSTHSAIEKLLKPSLKEHFDAYFHLHPSERVEPRYPKGFPGIQKWLPNNSISYIEYQPEFERYGGPTGLKIAEEHFQLSSEIVLHYIAQKKVEWSYYEALGIGIKLHLSFAHSVGMDIVETLAFFKYLFYNWLPSSSKVFAISKSSKHSSEKEQATIEAFSKAWESQKNVIRPFHQALWEALDRLEEFEDNQLNIWIDGVRKTKAALKDVDEEKKLHLLKFRNSNHDFTQYKTSTFWPFYSSYIHMTNNRLGIFNHDEGYLAYLIMKGVGEIK